MPPGGALPESRPGTIDGLKRATDSMAYSIVKQAPMNTASGRLSPDVNRNRGPDLLEVLFKYLAQDQDGCRRNPLELGQAALDFAARETPVRVR